MNCEEVQKYLSDFLDKSLDIARARAIEEHLAACSRCSEEMASLAECQRLVSDLPVVEPPVGFTNRVMAAVREAGRPRSLWERLFFPLQIKIPLQATAVVLIGVLAAYIHQKESLQRESVLTVQPESSSRKQDETDKLAPSVTQAPTTTAKTKENAEESKARVQKFKDSAHLKEPQSPPKPEEQNQGASSQPDSPGIARSQDPSRSPATLSPIPLQEKSSSAGKAAPPRLEQSSPSGGVQAKGALTPVPQPEKESVSKDAAAAGKSLSFPEPREGKAAPSLDVLRSGTGVGTALPADRELAIRLKEPLRDDKATRDRLTSRGTEAQPRSLPSQEEAKALNQARQQATQTGESQTVWVTIARNQYELFKKELADMGNIEVESSTPDRENDAIARSSDRLRIKVTILPPLASGNLAPSRP
ncbi:MAG TPA: DUF2275 domain-containing protein [Candidatus Binatia bacterium]|nr:DUF2275 domain-containing protein [Candidatus Binatia bacterium]